MAWRYSTKSIPYIESLRISISVMPTEYKNRLFLMSEDGGNTWYLITSSDCECISDEEAEALEAPRKGFFEANDGTKLLGTVSGD